MLHSSYAIFLAFSCYISWYHLHISSSLHSSLHDSPTCSSEHLQAFFSSISLNTPPVALPSTGTSQATASRPSGVAHSEPSAHHHCTSKCFPASSCCHNQLCSSPVDHHRSSKFQSLNTSPGGVALCRLVMWRIGAEYC
ncbi:hypothetical protein DL98DRAFT_249428 [Cadophora sp. DSE1049]|nr:hypothetical protein DL98DRAFT_249428 [Cadophora sp. DSE1049]